MLQMYELRVIFKTTVKVKLFYLHPRTVIVRFVLPVISTMLFLYHINKPLFWYQFIVGKNMKHICNHIPFLIDFFINNILSAIIIKGSYTVYALSPNVYKLS